MRSHAVIQLIESSTMPVPTLHVHTKSNNRRYGWNWNIYILWYESQIYCNVNGNVGNILLIKFGSICNRKEEFFSVV